MTQHTYITKRDCPICDFCLGSRVRWAFPCSTTIAAVAMAGDTLMAVAETAADPWSACDKCAAVVVQRDPMRLAAHVANSTGDPEARAMLAHPEFCAVLIQSWVELYTRVLPELGKPIPCTEFIGPSAGQTIEIVEEPDYD